jgi:hypothetical protein
MSLAETGAIRPVICWILGPKEGCLPDRGSIVARHQSDPRSEVYSDMQRRGREETRSR